MKHTTLFLLLVFNTLAIIFPASLAQTCQLPGTQCAFHPDCCGGCCNQGTCIDTTESCMEETDPCDVHYCPGGMLCHIYQPDCMGCSPYPICREH